MKKIFTFLFLAVFFTADPCAVTAFAGDSCRTFSVPGIDELSYQDVITYPAIANFIKAVENIGWEKAFAQEKRVFETYKLSAKKIKAEEDFRKKVYRCWKKHGGSDLIASR